jgi:deoxyadenosine/deoxycytidine kinase
MKKNLYIAVMGSLGSGKTTAARLIAKEFGFTLLEENFGENAFLPRFYQDMKRWAFHSQAFYLMEKITQILQTSELLKTKAVVQDTPIYQDAFSYAKAQHVLDHMDDEEWKLYQKIYKSFEPQFPKPNLIIFLDASMDSVMERIGTRGRSFEQKIPQSYLELLDMLNRKWLLYNKKIPVLVVKTDGLNIAEDTAAQEQFLALVKKRLRL